MAGCVLKPKVISGNAFIVDEKGKAQKLPLVTIGLYREAEIRQAVEKADGTLKKKIKEAGSRLASVGQRCDQLKRERVSGEDALKKLEERLGGLEKTRPQNPKYYKTADTEVFTSTTKASEPFSINPAQPQKTAAQEREERETREQQVYQLMAQKWRGEYDQAKQEQEKGVESLKKLEDEIRALEGEMTALVQFLDVRRQEIFLEILSPNLPAPVVTTKTDADGDFVFTSLPRGKLVVFARHVLDGKAFIWLLKLPENPSKDGRILLNNENLLSANPSNTVFGIREN